MQKFVLVPVEPTEEMNKAGIRWLTGVQHMREGDKRNALNEAFKAMLAAAPQPQALSGELEALGYMNKDTGKLARPDSRAIAVGFNTALVDRAHVTRLQAEVERLAEDRDSHQRTCIKAMERGAELEGLLRNLVRDCMASDFNEHWDSFKAADAALAEGKEHE